MESLSQPGQFEDRWRSTFEQNRFRDSLAFATVSDRGRWIAGSLTVASLLAVIAVAPVAGRQAGQTAAFLPIVVTVAAFALALTASVMYSQYRATSYAPLAYIGHAYAASAVLMVAYILTYPGVFVPGGLFGADRQTAPWLLSFWRIAFLVFIGLAIAQSYAEKRAWAWLPRFSMWTSSAAVAASLIALLLIAIRYEAVLPILISDHQYTPTWYHVVAPMTLTLNLADLVALIAITRLDTLVALWLAVVLFATLSETAMVSLLPGGRYSYGWYFARAEWIVAATSFYFAINARIMHIMGGLYRRNHELHRLATVDELTGVLNRRGFEERLERVARQAARSGDSLAFIAIDIDEFKLFNDQFGHPAGSRALAAVGAALRAAGLRSDDFCGRVGGDEFAIVLSGVDAAGVMSVAERARLAIKLLNVRHASAAANEILTVSIGIASNGGDSSVSPDDLVVRADEALYRSKRSGRNRISISPSYALARSAGEAR